MQIMAVYAALMQWTFYGRSPRNKAAVACMKSSEE